MKQQSILFVPRTKAWVDANPDDKIGNKLEGLWKDGHPSSKTNLCTLKYLDQGGAFDFNRDGRQVYVISGHGTPNCSTCFWKDKTSTVDAVSVADQTVLKFPQGNFGDVKLKIHSCHSSETGVDSFASVFAAAFEKSMRLTQRTGRVEIFGYEGALSVAPQLLTSGNITNSTEFLRTSPHLGHLSSTEHHRYTKSSPARSMGAVLGEGLGRQGRDRRVDISLNESGNRGNFGCLTLS